MKNKFITMLLCVVCVAAFAFVISSCSCNTDDPTRPQNSGPGIHGTTGPGQDSEPTAPPKEPPPTGPFFQGPVPPVMDGNLVVVGEDGYRFDKQLDDGPNELLDMYVQGDPWFTSSNRGYEMYMTREAGMAFREMMKAFVASPGGHNRTNLYSYHKNMNETDELRTGLAFELRYYEASGNKLHKHSDYSAAGSAYHSSYKWMQDNAADYGFIESRPGGFRYVGVSHAQYMLAEGLTLAEFVERIRTHEDATVFYIAENVSVKYYIEKIEIDPLVGYSYKWSGDGKDGFILTVFPTPD